MLRVSCLKLEINEVRCYEAQIEESEKRPAAARSRTQDTSGLSRQCSGTEPRQPDNHQPSQSSMCDSRTTTNPHNPLCAYNHQPSQSSMCVYVEDCEGWWLSNTHCGRAQGEETNHTMIATEIVCTEISSIAPSRFQSHLKLV